ncbi:hypothetical protein [[Clostridium] colinum]|uniref:hypothetical protein n=1 Tax=[Clostridium] colinum TaxID=36835 RepID=UPI002023D2D2|nr:hypothetical protein [[Clostridium] colinum]
MIQENKILHDLTMFYLQKNNQSFKDIKDLFNQYINAQNQLTNLFDAYLQNKNDYNEYLEEYFKVIDDIIE